MTQSPVKPDANRATTNTSPEIEALVAKFNDAKQREKLASDEVVKLHAYYKEAYKLSPPGFDFSSQTACKTELQKAKNWHKLIDTYAKAYPWAMYCLIQYRKDYVDQLLGECAQAVVSKESPSKNPSLVAKSVGSTDLTSDYDITIAAPDGKDVAILREFNRRVKQDFGAQPGTVFDTNVYVKDYVKVKGEITFSGVTMYTDTDVTRQDTDWRMSDGDQDIAALVKQRRFSTDEEWLAYVTKVCTGLPDVNSQILVRRQYDLADALFDIAVRDLLTALEEQFRTNPAITTRKLEKEADFRQAIDANLGPIAMLYKRFEKEVPLPSLTAIWETAKKAKPDAKANQTLAVAMQEKNANLLNAIRVEFEDLILEVSNELYAKIMERVRKVQIETEIAQSKLNEGASKVLDKKEKEALEKEIIAKKAIAKYEIGQAIFFASEAYHTEGAVLDIVMGSQEKDPDEKKKIREKLLPVHLLESFNEQYGDFLKDVKHYAHGKALDKLTPEEAGKLYYRCSKYLTRLFSGIAELPGKPGCAELAKLPIAQLLKLSEEKAVTFRTTTLETLLSIRKGQYVFKDAEAALKPEEKAFNLLKAQEITSAQDFVDRITALAQAFNIEARKCMGQTIYATDKDTRSFVSAYGQYLKG